MNGIVNLIRGGGEGGRCSAILKDREDLTFRSLWEGLELLGMTGYPAAPHCQCSISTRKLSNACLLYTSDAADDPRVV